jgi:hypothetical protein
MIRDHRLQPRWSFNFSLTPQAVFDFQRPSTLVVLEFQFQPFRGVVIPAKIETPRY